MSFDKNTYVCVHICTMSVSNGIYYVLRSKQSFQPQLEILKISLNS